TDQEQRDLWRAVREAVGEQTAIIAGTGSNDTAHAIELTRAAEEDGMDAVLAVTPYYNRPPQAGLLAHFRAVAGSTALPVVLYDIPGRSVVKIDHSTLIELAGTRNIVAVKDAVGSVQGVARLIAEAPEGFEVYCGNDADTLPWLSVGAVGVIAVASHVAGPQMAEMIRLFTSGDPAGARKIHLDLMPVFDAMGITTNPIPVKACMEIMGHKVGGPRLPLIPADDAQRALLKDVLTSAGVL
ncbi:MAG TPA: 4-hydroxy-tetrahydrodipicolinate synthase, partial [Actinomycetota bacterium]|nr:4-hydroxy-tetrahydrodipicolinate synthase [Actinomycetota bacterium]